MSNKIPKEDLFDILAFEPPPVKFGDKEIKIEGPQQGYYLLNTKNGNNLLFDMNTKEWTKL